MWGAKENTSIATAHAYCICVNGFLIVFYCFYWKCTQKWHTFRMEFCLHSFRTSCGLFNLWSVEKFVSIRCDNTSNLRPEFLKLSFWIVGCAFYHILITQISLTNKINETIVFIVWKKQKSHFVSRSSITAIVFKIETLQLTCRKVSRSQFNKPYPVKCRGRCITINDT